MPRRRSHNNSDRASSMDGRSVAVESLGDDDDDDDDDDDGGHDDDGSLPRSGGRRVPVHHESYYYGSTSNSRPSLFVIQMTAMASLGGILFGYDLGVISGALPQMVEAFQLSNLQQELVVSVLYVGGGLGAMIGGSVCDTFGRKRAILLTDVWFLLGAVILATAWSVEIILLGRVVVGFAVAVSGIADVSYLHEIAPIRWRGVRSILMLDAVRGDLPLYCTKISFCVLTAFLLYLLAYCKKAIVSVNEACISLGFLLAFTVGSVLSAEGSTSGWRIMFAISGVVAMVQLLGMWNMPESPQWLRKQGRLEESEEALRMIHSAHSFQQVQQELENSMQQSAIQTTYDTVNTDQSLNSNAENAVATLRQHDGLIGRVTIYCCQLVYLLQQLQVFAKETINRYRRQAYIAIFLSVAQQLCGQTNVLSYAPLIFANASGGSHSSASFVRGWSTLSIGLVKFAVTVVVIWKIERVGRRFLLLLGIGTISVGLLLVAIAFRGSTTDPQQESMQDASRGFYLALPGVLLIVCGYSMSFGPLTWLLTSELFPTEIRGRALGLSTIVTYMCAALVTSTFLTAQDWFGTSAVFIFYLSVTALSFLFAYAAVPDTKEKSAEDIDGDLNMMLWWRGIGASSGSGDAYPLFPSTEVTLIRPDSEFELS